MIFGHLNLFGAWILEFGVCPSLPWGKMYDIEQHVVLPFQDAEFVGRGTSNMLMMTAMRRMKDAENYKFQRPNIIANIKRKGNGVGPHQVVEYR